MAITCDYCSCHFTESCHKSPLRQQRSALIPPDTGSSPREQYSLDPQLVARLRFSEQLRSHCFTCATRKSRWSMSVGHLSTSSTVPFAVPVMTTPLVCVRHRRGGINSDGLRDSYGGPERDKHDRGWADRALHSRVNRQFVPPLCAASQ